MLVLSVPAFGADGVDALAAKINAAHKARHYKAMESDLGRLLKLLPGFPQGIYLLAIARADRGDSKGALAALDQLADMGLHFDIRKQADFASLRNAPGFESLAKRFAANLEPVGRAESAFRLKDKAFLPEGIAYDSSDGDFFVSSVHLRKIVRVHGGQISTFADRSSGLWGVFGIRVDAEHDALWATSAALPQAQGFVTEDDGRTALFRFDLRSGALLAKYPVPHDGQKHQFNDLTVAPDGTVYVADGNGGVYVLKPGAKALAPLTPAGRLRSAQGLALSRDGRLLYVADYVGGLFAYDLEANKLARVHAPADVCVYGIDGMVRYGHDLVVTENSTQPQRIIRLHLDDTGLAITSSKVLEANDPLVPEPTLLAIAQDKLHAVANSQWSRFDDQGRLKAGAALAAPLIVNLPLH
ncbi:MAG: SMP-30/gluconolactonase/LRE family protein [Rhodanobacteraceae bacterium]